MIHRVISLGPFAEALPHLLAYVLPHGSIIRREDTSYRGPVVFVSQEAIWAIGTLVDVKAGTPVPKKVSEVKDAAGKPTGEKVEYPSIPRFYWCFSDVEAIESVECASYHPYRLWDSPRGIEPPCLNAFAQRLLVQRLGIAFPELECLDAITSPLIDPEESVAESPGLGVVDEPVSFVCGKRGQLEMFQLW